MMLQSVWHFVDSCGRWIFSHRKKTNEKFLYDSFFTLPDIEHFLTSEKKAEISEEYRAKATSRMSDDRQS